MPSPASQTRVRPPSVACHGSGASRCGPCMLPAICAGPWWWTKLSPPSASNAAATTYSCSAVRGACRRLRCGRPAGLRVAAGDMGQQLRRPRRHGTHGDGRDRTRQRRAVRWSVLPEPRGISGKVPAGCYPGHRSAVRDVRFGAIRAVASQLLYCGGGVERGALLQRLRALPRQEGGRDWLREALRASTLRVRVVRVLPAVFQGRPW